MDGSGQDKIMAFDTLFTTNHIQMMKIFMSYLDRPMQKTLAIYIKYMELQYTISFFRTHPGAALNAISTGSEPDISAICEAMLPFCSHREKEQMEHLRNMFQTFRTYKDMMEMMQMMKEFFPDGMNPMSGDFQAADLLSGMAGANSTGGMNGESGMPDIAGIAGMLNSSGFDISQLFTMMQAMSGHTPPSDNDDNPAP